MEKYGVDEEVKEDKEAQQGEARCPKCDAVLRDTEVTGVLVCPNCGTQPFERK